MPVTDIKEIRLLPPLAIGRFGDSAEPMHNYDAVIGDPTGFRDLVPADTLIVEPNGGEIVQKLRPTSVRFKDGAGRIKPVCPFVEVWARFDAETDLRPLTLTELGELRRGPEHLSWDVTFANLKMLRRTGDPGDAIESKVLAINDHARHRLAGRARNFKSDRSVHFGWLQYVKPTAAFPEIRFRFTPPAGQVYGSRQDSVVSTQNAVYDATLGTWPRYTDDAPPTGAPDPRAHLTTIPQFIYARNRTTRANLGYFDDSSDGVITVTMTMADGRQLSSFARASAGPPDFAPDSEPVRSMGDELEQLALGPFAADVTVDEVLDIVRRALETMRLMDTALWNERYAGNAFDPPSKAAYGAARAAHTSLLATLAKGLAAPANSTERQLAHASLTRMNEVLREYDDVADMRAAARQHMPALMRGADGNDLALNRRQRSKLRRALKVFQPAPDQGSPEMVAMTRLIGTFQAMAGLHAQFAEDNRTLADRFADPPAVLDYLRKAVAKGSVATAAGLAGKPLVVAGDPQNSAFLLTISRPEHPMNGPLSSYRDSQSAKSGLQVIQDWITSLAPGA
jgi:hypothetical protein